MDFRPLRRRPGIFLLLSRGCGGLRRGEKEGRKEGPLFKSTYTGVKGRNNRKRKRKREEDRKWNPITTVSFQLYLLWSD